MTDDQFNDAVEAENSASAKLIADLIRARDAVIAERDAAKQAAADAADLRDQWERQAFQMQAERDSLKAKVIRQRTQLRSLNKTLRSIWEGVRFAHKCRRDMQENRQN